MPTSFSSVTATAHAPAVHRQETPASFDSFVTRLAASLGVPADQVAAVITGRARAASAQ